MYLIEVPEREAIDENDDNEDGNYSDYEDQMPEIQLIWASEYLDKDNLMFKTKSKYQWFGEQFHSAISIQDRNDKERFKGTNKAEQFKKIQEYFFFFDSYHMYMFYKIQRDKTKP